MRIPVDRGGDVPLHRQIAGRLRSAILSGAHAPGTRLPSSRALAEELGVSRVTVVNAYALLADDGLVVTGEGRGTFVAAVPGRSPGVGDPDRTWPLWQRDLAAAGAARRSDGALPVGALPVGAVPVGAVPVGGAPVAADVVSFTGVGDPRLFPVAELARTVREVLAADGAAALEYGAFGAGFEPLRATVASVLAHQGIDTRAGSILVTSGSQQALALVCQVLLARGDTVIVEQPTYDLALDLFRALGLRIVGVPTDDAGLRVDLLEPLLQQHHPRLLYTVPTFANPTGASLETPRRRDLLALAARYNVPVVEDDFAGDLRYEGRGRPALKALDDAGQVVYLGTFAKLLAPGLRVGYLVADGPVLDRLVEHKRVHDLATSPLLQRVVDRYVTVGRYTAHLRRTTKEYRRRRDTLLEALARELPQLRCRRPEGGLFAWGELPAAVDSRELAARAAAAGVEVAPGGRFFVHPDDGASFVRFNFAAVTPDEIDRGVRRLREVLDRS